MNWLDFIDTKEFKNYLPLIFEERTGNNLLKASIKKVNDEKFGTCFICDILLKENNTKFVQTMKFGQYGIIDENTNEYEFDSYHTEFLRFMILSMQNKKIGNKKYEDAYIHNCRKFLLEKRKNSILDLAEISKENLKKKLKSLDVFLGSILQVEKQDKTVNYDNKTWLDLVDINIFKRNYLPKVLKNLFIKPNEVVKITKENNQKFGPCVTIETLQNSDYYGINGYIYGENDVINSYNFDYTFAQFGLVSNNKYDINQFDKNKEFFKFMVTETMGKTINNKSYSDELKAFIKVQKNIIKQEAMQNLETAIKKENKYFEDEIAFYTKILKETIKDIYANDLQF